MDIWGLMIMKLYESDYYNVIIVLPPNVSAETIVFHQNMGRRIERDDCGNIRVLEYRDTGLKQ